MSWLKIRLFFWVSIPMLFVGVAQAQQQRAADQFPMPQCSDLEPVSKWNNCVGGSTNADNDVRIGEFLDGKRNGQGTDMFADGSKYIGGFRDGNRNGQGTFTFANGDSYIGEFRDGKRNGQGTDIYADGSKYIGEFRDDNRNGQGTFTFANGVDKYVGGFHDGMFNGQGTLTTANGHKYIGEFRDGNIPQAPSATASNADDFSLKYLQLSRDDRARLLAAVNAQDFSLNYLGFGPISVHTSLTILNDGSHLSARATNDTDQPIKVFKLCLYSEPAAKGCLFEMSTNEAVKPGDYVEWNVTSKQKPRTDFHGVRIESLTRFSNATLSQSSLSEAKALVDSNPLKAESLVDKSLKFDPSNENALSLGRLIRARAATAEGALREAEIAIRAGNIEIAGAKLEALFIYRAKFPAQFDNAERNLNSATVARSARLLWIYGRTAEAIRALADVGDSADKESFAFTTSAQLRKEIVDSQIAKAQEVGTVTTDDFSKRASLLHIARDADPSSPAVKKLISANFEGFVDSLSKSLPVLKPKGASSEARLRLAFRMSAADRLGEKTDDPSLLLSAAYPFLRVNVAINDPRGCLPKDAQAVLEGALRQGLSPVAEITQSDWDLQFSLAAVSCPHADIPRQSVESVNSTYVAGHNQFANPSYVQLQTELASAQAALNQVNANANANPNPNMIGALAQGLARGKAEGRVDQLRNALANTPPYSTENILQAYQYQRFESFRAAGFTASLIVTGRPGRPTPVRISYNVKSDLSAGEEDGARGASGVLAGDSTAALNVEPTLKRMDELVGVAWTALVRKWQQMSRAQLAGYLATAASDKSIGEGDRISAMLYLSDIAKDTDYESEGSQLRDRFRVAAIGGESALLKLGGNITLHHPEQSGAQQGAVETSGIGSVETALEGVVAIETDQGISGSGFFVGSQCHVITNEHVIAGASTIVLRTAQRGLYSAQVLASDSRRDLAILTTNAQKCSPLELGSDESPNIGTEVFAVGNPLGLQGTVTKGIISARREIEGVKYFQIDASLNPGNSGGPLLTPKGLVLGVNTFKRKGYEGLNFAITSEEVKAAFGHFEELNPAR